MRRERGIQWREEKKRSSREEVKRVMWREREWKDEGREERE